MDIYDYFNSTDVAEHLMEVGYDLNAMEAAYIVELCESATLDEKVVAWQGVIETMSDCPMAKHPDFEDCDSVHNFLRERIDLQGRMLDLFGHDEGCVFFLRELRYLKWPDSYPARKDGQSLWIEDFPQPFSTLRGCVDYLRAGREEDGDEFDRYVISKAKVDFVGEPYEGRQNEIVLDGDFNPLSVSVGSLSECESDLAYRLESTFLKLPVPFRRGDIVIDRTARNPHPFVFDRLKFWNSAELVEHGCDVLPPDKAAKLDKRVANRDERGSWDDSDMAACGYELGSQWTGGLLADPCDLCYDVFGAGCNYLNLERYTGPLEGNLKILEIASRLVKGEIDVECALNFSLLATLKHHASELERSYDSEYVPEVRRLYKAGEPR